MLSIFGDLDFTELMLDHFYRLLRGFTGFYLVFYELLLTGSRFVFGSIFPFFLFPLDLGSRVAILAGIPYNMIHFRADVIRIIISIRTKRATKWQRVDRDLFVCLFVCLFVKKKSMDSLQGCRLDSAAADSGSSSSLAAVRRDSLTSSKGSLYSTDADRSPSDQVSIAARVHGVH